MIKNNLYIIILIAYFSIIVIRLIILFNEIKRKKKQIDLNKFFLRMNIGLLILSLPLLLFSSLFHVNLLDYKSPMPYSAHKQITLKEFKGFKLPGQKLHGMKEFAFIKTSISYYIKDNSVVIDSYFHPSRSYAFNKNAEDEALLKHELCHFSITEYWAREFRKRVSLVNALPSTSELTVMYLEIKALENQMQMDYDEASYHGYVLKEQEDWENKVDSLLNSLDKFKFNTAAFND